MEFPEYILQIPVVIFQCEAEDEQIVKIDVHADAYCIAKDNSH